METIEALFKKYKTIGHEVLVVEDFNTDFTKNNSYLKAMVKMMKTTQLKPADLYFSQTSDHTYFKQVENVTHKSWIDHVLYSSGAKIVCCKITPDTLNKGDHHPIVTTIELRDDGKYDAKLKTKNKYFWNNIEFIL